MLQHFKVSESNYNLIFFQMTVRIILFFGWIGIFAYKEKSIKSFTKGTYLEVSAFKFIENCTCIKKETLRDYLHTSLGCE